ncbi:MAG: Fic family protein [Bacteroidales bacterium]|nr:Fic family protein [Bacteroidales bacterium]
MDKYLNKLNFDFQTNQKILTLISEIDLYKGKWNSIEKQENIYLKELKKIATIESIGSSTRIEGGTLTDKEIEELLNDVKITKLKTRDEQEVVGYYDTLEIIFENYDNISLTENYIKQLHQNLLRHSDKDTRHRGGYKSLSNKVVASYPGGVQKVIFNTTDVHLVASEMYDIISWTNNQLEKKEIHSLIIIANFIYEFLSIHPFQDGNGRLSRLLTTLLLLQSDYLFIQYVSFENLIEKTKKEYYQALMEGQKNRSNEMENISNWTLYFLDKLRMLSERLDAKYDVFKSKGGYLNERQKMIKDYLIENQPSKISDLAKEFVEINIHTIKKDIQYMKKERIIKSIGKGKGTIYLIDNERHQK